MKKLIIVYTAFLFTIATKVSAQALIARLTTTGNQPIMSYLVPNAILAEGENTVVLPEARATLKFVKHGDSFSNVVFLDSMGPAISMDPANGGSNGAPKPECKSKLPDSCFGNPDKNIGVCMCKPGDLSGGYKVVLVFPRTLARYSLR